MITLLMLGLLIFGTPRVFSQAYTFTAGNLTYNENFDAMGPTGTTYLPGWTGVRFAGTGAIGQTLTLIVSDGSGSNLSGGVYNAGTTDATDRAMGTLGSGSTIPRFGAYFLNNTGSPITQIDFTGVMEQWRTGSNAVVEDVAFNYSIDATDLMTGTWQPLTSMDLIEVQTGSTTAAAIDGNLPENQAAINGTITGLTWAPGAVLWISWTDANDAGSDGIYAIDNFHMTVTTGGFTPDPEPSNYPTSFSATASGFSIALNWTDATGAQLPAGYLIKASTANNITAPVDGTPVADDIDLSDGTGAKNIPQGVETYTFNNLPENSTIYFKIYPYTNAGAYINYKTDGTVPAANASTPSIIHTQNFDSGLVPWTTYSVIGDQVWTLDTLHGVGGSKCMKMTGFVNPNSFDNEDWLISAPINLSGFINTSLNFQTAMNYGADTTTWFSALISTNYTGSGDPNSATWTPLTATLSPGSWTWTPSGIIDISALSGQTFYLAFKYTCNTTNARTWEVDNVMVMGVAGNTGYHVGGTLTYANSAHTPMNNVTLDLKNGSGNVVGTTTTNSSGVYSFTGVGNGNYTLEPSTNKAWGGVTATDVLLYKKHIATITPLTGIYLASGDVNGVGGLSATDVLLIKKRIATITNSFTVGDWLFDNTSFTVLNADVTQNLNGLTYGDANGSYTPPAAKSLENSAQINENVDNAAIFTIETVNAASGKIIVPVHASQLQNLGALQYSINYDAASLEFDGIDNWYNGIEDVTVGTPVKGNITFVWAADNDGITIEDGTLCNLHFTVLKSETSSISWSNEPTPAEFSDYNASTFVPTLKDGTIEASTGLKTSENTAVGIYPNPGNGKITITLPENGQKEIKVYSLLGSLVYSQLTDQTSLKLDLSNLNKGIYSLRIVNLNNQNTTTKKLIIK